MKQTEKELIGIKEELSQMWRLVLSQLEKAKQAFFSDDVNLAREIASREKRVNTFELKIDSDCENFIALYNPVAIDLRLVLSLIKISSTLERIGDFAQGIARHVIDDECSMIKEKTNDTLELEKMFDTVIEMLSDTYVALETENTKLVGKILSKDEVVDEIYFNSVNVLADHIRQHPEEAECGLKTMLMIRKIERIGDHCSNIVEEIVFYVDAKVLKHKSSTE